MFVVYGVIGIVIVMVMLLQYSKSYENGEGSVTAAESRTMQSAELWRSRQATAAAADMVDAKEIIMARSQRRVYGLNGDVVNAVDSRWAHELMISWCTKLDDGETDVSSLERIVNGFCGRVENVVERYLTNLSQYHKQLAVITECSDTVEKQMSKTVAEEKFAAENDSYSDVESVSPDRSSAQCLITAASQDDLLSIYEQFVGEIQEIYL